MLRQDFDDGIADLELQFGKISAKDNDMQKKKEMYWKRFSTWLDSDFRAVVDTLLDTWEPRTNMRFPFIRHFVEIYNGMTGAKDDKTEKYEIPENERLIPGEMSVMQDIVRIIRGMHKDGEIWRGERLQWPVRHVPLQDRLSPDEWEKAGKPPLWSPVFEEYYSGVIRPMLSDIETGGNSMLAYMVDFREKLVNRHKKQEEVVW